MTKIIGLDFGQSDSNKYTDSRSASMNKSERRELFLSFLPEYNRSGPFNRLTAAGLVASITVLKRTVFGRLWLCVVRGKRRSFHSSSVCNFVFDGDHQRTRCFRFAFSSWVFRFCFLVLGVFFFFPFSCCFRPEENLVRL